jgi:ketosteroid isomerase-like protein
MPLTVEDRLEMITLVGRYNHAIDAREAEAWADTFTEDGRFFSPPRYDIQGRPDLIYFVESLGAPSGQHWATNFVIEGDKDNATMLADLFLIRGNKAGGRGKYINTLERVDGKWKFALRHYIYTLKIGDSMTRDVL